MLRLLPGTYTQLLFIDSTRTTPQLIVGTGATLTTRLDVRGGANVDARDLTVNGSGSSSGVQCGNLVTEPVTTLRLRDFSVTVESSTALINLIHCDATLERGDIDMANFGDGAINQQKATSLTADRIYVHSRSADSRRGWSVFDSGSKARITNSVFENAGTAFVNNDMALGAEFYFAYNTFVMTSGAFVSCFTGSGVVLDARFENNIIYSTTADEPLAGTKCTFAHNIVFPFAGALPAGNIIADPQLVNVAAKDYHLQATSKAVDAAGASQVSLDVDHDFEGTARPQGPKPDLGALEFH